MSIDTNRTRADQLEAARRAQPARGSRCTTRHFSKSTCPTCTTEIPVGPFTTEEHQVYFEGSIIWGGDPSPTPIAQLQAIEKATDDYNAAVRVLGGRRSELFTALREEGKILAETSRIRYNETGNVVADTMASIDGRLVMLGPGGFEREREIRKRIAAAQEAADDAEVDLRAALTRLNAVSRGEEYKPRRSIGERIVRMFGSVGGA